MPWLGEPSNPSSLHSEGRKARGAVDKSRETVASLLGCLFGEIHFTSSGTEAANLAIIGTALANQDKTRNRVVLGAAEHHCVLHTKSWLEKLGYQVTLVRTNQFAQILPEAYSESMGDDVLLASVMQANNELGTWNDLDTLNEVAKSHGSLFHTDCVQTFPFCGTVEELGVDLLSASSHKVYGPPGAGVLYIRAGTKISPTIVGGGQEREMRAGTENVSSIVGFATAARWCADNENLKQHKKLVRDKFAARLLSGGFIATVDVEVRTLPGHFHCRLPGVDAETVLIALDRRGVSASSGAACSSGSLEPSHVLRACGYSHEESREGLRFTFGKDTLTEDAMLAAEIALETAHEIMIKR